MSLTERPELTVSCREVEALRAEKFQDRASFPSTSIVAPPPKASPSFGQGPPPPRASAKASPRSNSFLPPTPIPIDARERSPLVSPPLILIPTNTPVAVVGRSHQRTASLQLLKTRMEDELGLEVMEGNESSTMMNGHSVSFFPSELVPSGKLICVRFFRELRLEGMSYSIVDAVLVQMCLFVELNYNCTRSRFSFLDSLHNSRFAA